MAPTLGFTALLLIISISFFLSFFGVLVYKKNVKTKPNELNEIFTGAFAIIFSLSVISQLCLIFSYLISDYSVLNVYQNSHHLKPLIYKISGSWGNHEGSMLLLVSIISGYGLAFALIEKNENKFITLSFQSLIILGLTAFTAFTSNPFERIFPAELTGLGLNPLLQDIGLALHPPVLYLGYVGFSIVFCLALTGLVTEKIDEALAKSMQFWLFLSWGFLTIGVGLGSWWAYRELGWGGYWFWDPVENVSLLPWLCATALVHSAKVLKSKNLFKHLTILLALSNFILSLIGIFLVRSGLLTSVHSFAVDAKRGFFIILLISIIGGIATLIYALKSSKIKTSSDIKIPFISKTATILINNYLLIIGIFTIALGTLYPIFLQSFFNRSLSIGAQYYNSIFAILLIPFLLFLIFSYFIKSNQLTLTKCFTIIKPKLSLALAMIASIAITIYAYLQKTDADKIAILLLFLAIFSSFLAIFSKKNVANISHLGFTLLVVGIILSSTFSYTKETNIKIGESVKLPNNLEIRFDKIEYFAGKNYIARNGVFIISKNARELYVLKPELRYYPISEQTTNEAAIKHQLSGDLYLAIGNKDENEYYGLRIYHKPFIYLMWLGCILIFYSALLKVYKVVQDRKQTN